MKLSKTQRIFAHTTFFSLFLSGLFWVLLNFILNNVSSLRFLNSWTLKIHGFAAFGFLILFGMTLSTHISFNWRVRKNRRLSGIILSGIFIFLIISGYLLYYLGDENVRNFLSHAHWIIGTISSAVFISHFKKKTAAAKL